jgi:PAS domain S-box-containing protein
MDNVLTVRLIADNPEKTDQIKALKESEVRYRRLFEAARDGILILDAKTGQIADVNPFLLEMLGYTHQELLGKKLWEIGLFKDIAASTAVFKNLQEKGYVRYQDLPLETKGGKPANVEFVSNMYVADGQKVIQCNIRDITERKKADNLVSMSLRILDRRKPGEQKELIHDLLLIIKELCHCEAVGIRLMDRDDFPYHEIQGFADAHLESENSLYSRDETGHICRDSSGKPALECMCGNIISGRFDPQKPFYTEGGSFWTNCATDFWAAGKKNNDSIRSRCIQEGYESIALIPLKSSEGIIGLLQLNSLKRDRFTLEMIKHFEGIGRSIGIVLNEKKSEEALQKSEEKYRGLINNVKSGIFRSTPGSNGKFLEINKAMEEITGYSRKELLNMDVSRLYAVPGKRPQSIGKTDRDGRALRVELLLKKKENTEIIVAITNTPISDETGKIIYLDGILEDITDHKKLETRTIENETLKKINAAKSDLLANVSHELRTPLASIKGFIETLIEADVKWSKKQQLDFLESADKETDRLTFLIRDLLDMSRIDSGRLKLDVRSYRASEILDSISGVLSVITVRHKLKVVKIPDLPLIQADKVRISQVISNLTENATKFSPQGSEIVIEVKAAKEKVVFSVEDKGVGMSEEVKRNLFNRFYQAKDVSGKIRGTGLGLVICKGIVEAHRGEIWAESKLGRGSTFSFSIPFYADNTF